MENLYSETPPTTPTDICSAENPSCFGVTSYEVEGDENKYCILHLPKKDKPKEAFETALQEKMKKGDSNYHRTWFPEEIQFQKVVFRNADFSQAYFSKGVDFSQADFTGTSSFKGTIFDSYASFRGTKYSGYVDFSYARFLGCANFGQSSFGGDADFIQAVFKDNAYFDQAHFHGEAEFTRVNVDWWVDFSGASFHKEALFIETTFRYEATFAKANFIGNVQFVDATFRKRVNFGQAHFGQLATFVNTTFGSDVSFAKATFSTQATFAANRRNAGFNLNAAVDFRDVLTFQPDSFSFRSVALRPSWFVRLPDASTLTLADVSWRGLPGGPSGNWHDEIRGAEREEDRQLGLSPYDLLAQAYRRLANNAETNQRHAEASAFRYLANNTLRHGRGRKAPFTLRWWYWLSNGYGERPLRALIWLLIVSALFTVVFQQTIANISYPEAFLYSIDTIVPADVGPSSENPDITTRVWLLVIVQTALVATLAFLFVKSMTSWTVRFLRG